MIYMDINTFFSPKAGGIRTYHLAKIAWFQKCPQHQYFLVSPGNTYKTTEVGPSVTLVEAFGPAVTHDPAGYRILLDYFRILTLIVRTKPDVLEAGDPWLTGLFCLALKKSGFYKGLLVSFYHSDPIPSYLMPWAQSGRFRGLKKIVVASVARLFYRLQQGYDLTATASKTMEMSLRKNGIQSIAYLPFGVPEKFLTQMPLRASGRSRLLYAGRLDREKGIELVLAAITKLLAIDHIEITVMGRGSYSEQFLEIKHPRYHFLGFLEKPEEVLAVYDHHDILLAPGPFETFGLGVLEAMARGMIVVGPDQGGTAELLQEVSSPFIFKADDLNDFLRKIDLARDSNPLEEAKRSMNLALKYGSWDQAVQRMARRYGFSMPLVEVAQ